MAAKKGKGSKRPAPAKRTVRPKPRPTSRPKPANLPHDTPVDVPAVTGTMIEHAPQVTTSSAESSLAARSETIEAAYDAWDELRSELASVKTVFAAERARLDEQGTLLIGAVQTAIAPTSSPSGLVHRTQLSSLAEEARQGLDAARADLEHRFSEATNALTDAIEQVVQEVQGRVSRQLVHAPPKLELMVRALPQGRRILHLRRLRPDEALTFLFAVSGRVPTRYGFLFDGSTDDATLPPPTLYAEEGITDVRPKAAELASQLSARARIWPVKAMIPMPAPFGLVRWLERGPVMEAELADGDGFRNLLTQAEAEQVTGALLTLKLEKKLELELVRG